jgi:hypothetical protein
VLIEDAKRDLLSNLQKDTALSFTYKGIAAGLRLLIADRKNSSGPGCMSAPAAATIKKYVELLATISEHKEAGCEESLAEISGEMAEAVKSLEEAKGTITEAIESYKRTVEAEMKEDLNLFMKDFTEEGLNQRKAGVIVKRWRWNATGRRIRRG